MLTPPVVYIGAGSPCAAGSRARIGALDNYTYPKKEFKNFFADFEYRRQGTVLCLLRILKDKIPVPEYRHLCAVVGYAGDLKVS